MTSIQKRPGYWKIKENVLAEAKKYKSISEWQSYSPSSVNGARQCGFFEEATAHMLKKEKPKGHWKIKENVIDDAKKYSKKGEWARKSGSAYNQAVKNNWLDEATSHME